MMKKTEIPSLCKCCKLYDEKSAYCAAYALRVALNDFKSSLREPFDSLFGREPREYNYDCDNFVPKQGISKFCFELGKVMGKTLNSVIIDESKAEDTE